MFQKQTFRVYNPSPVWKKTFRIRNLYKDEPTNQHSLFKHVKTTESLTIMYIILHINKT